MNVTDRLKSLDFKGRDFPLLRGDVKMTLKNVHNGKTEVIEKHNASTNALSDIFGGNYGGLLNYNNMADLYSTYLGGVLLFDSALDPSTPNDYGIPARTSKAVTAHAGRTPLTDQADDLTRGNPDTAGTVLQAGSTKLVWEWGTSAGNGTIASLGLTHSDVGSYGCGVTSAAQKLLKPFADVGFITKNLTYGDNATPILAIDGNTAYSFYMASNTSVKVYKTPINNTKYKLQGGSLNPLTDYSSSITVTLSASYALNAKGGCYYWFDFANNRLVLFGVPTEGSTTLYMDVISLSTWSDQTAVHTSITVTGANLWKFKIPNQVDSAAWNLRIPVKAMVYNNHLFVYGYTTSNRKPNRIYIINLANTADISQVDVSDYETFYTTTGYSLVSDRCMNLGGLIVHDSFLINGDKAFELNSSSSPYCYDGGRIHVCGYDSGISSPAFGLGTDLNCIAINKLYLATKWNLNNPVTKNASQAMTVEYTLTEV